MPSKLLPVLLVAGLLATAARGDDVSASEGALQAALLVNFAAYTDWPALPAGITPSDKLVFCVMGSPVVSEALSERKNKIINGKLMEVRSITSNEQAFSCQVLFLGYHELANLAQLSQLTRHAPLLLVTEEKSLPTPDAIISLQLQDGRYTFKVNRTAAQARSLNLSAKLLRLATQVY